MNRKLLHVITVPFIALLFGLAVAAGLGLGLAPVERAQALGNTYYVDDDTCPATGSGTQPDPYCRIQDAVDAANDGDEIRVAAGTYTETIDFDGKILVLNGAGAASTTIDGRGGLDSVVDRYHGAVVTISGVTIQNGSAGYPGGGGIYNEESALMLLDVTVFNNTTGSSGGGILSLGGTVTLSHTAVVSNASGHGGGICSTNNGATLVLIDSAVVSNTSSGIGGGIYSSKPLTITHSTVATNTATDSGGGLCNQGAVVVFTDVTLRNNEVTDSSANGGGIYNAEGMVQAVGSTIAVNRATGYGGGIYNLGTGGRVILTDVTLDGNTGDIGGGIMNVDGCTVTLTASTVSGNVAGSGAGIRNHGVVTLTNVTVSGNEANDDGGGLLNYFGTTALINSSVVSNTADVGGSGGDGGGIYSRDEHTVTLKNTIVAGNVDGSGSGDVHPDCSGTLHSQDYNLIQDTSGCTLVGVTAHVITGADPLLGPLQDNGGPSTGSGPATFTHALLNGSPAIDAADDAACPATDQRGILRPKGAHCDIGAYEFVPVAPASVSISGSTEGLVGESYAFTTTVSPPTVTLPITYTWSPTPASGQGTDVATYTWITPGDKTITVTVENVAGAAPPGTHDIAIAEYKVYLPLVVRGLEGLMVRD